MNIVEHSPGGFSTQASIPTERLIRNSWLGKRLAIANRLYKHNAPGEAQNIKRCPIGQMNTVFLAVGTTAEVNKEVYILKFG